LPLLFAPHPAARPDPALARPGRDPAGDLGSADRLPGDPPRHDRRRRVRSRHRPGPRRLHRRPGNRAGPGHRRPERTARPGAARPPRPDRSSCPGQPAPGTPATHRSPQEVKCPISRYASPPDQLHLPSTARITAIGITICQAPAAASDGRRDRTLQLIRTDPHRSWPASEIARSWACLTTAG